MKRLDLAIAAIVALSFACKKDPPLPAVVDATPPATIASQRAVDSGPAKSATDEDKKHFADYSAALVRGRQATIAKKWSDANKAFDDALAARPGDHRALAEKGYAEYLAGDRKAARRDLELASKARDPKLGSQVWFNLGLVDAASGDKEGSLVDFWFADKLAPNLAAQAKIAGRTVCPVKIDRVRKPATHATSWMDVARIMAAEAQACKMPASTETEAKASLLKTFTGEPNTGSVTTNASSEFFLIRSSPLGTSPDICPFATMHVLEVGKSDFWIYPSGASGTLKWMTPMGETETLEPLGGFLVGRRVESIPMDVVFCTVDGGEEHECNDEPGEVFASMMKNYRPSPPVYRDDVIDPSTHEQVLSLEDAASQRFSDLADDGGGRATSLRGTGTGGLELVGLGCNLQFSRGDGGL